MPHLWKRLYSHILPKEENSDPLNISATSSRRSSVASLEGGRSHASNNPQEEVRRVSPFSYFSSHHGPSSEVNSRGPSPEPEQKPGNTLGLHVVYQPASTAPLDIIFVHGLAGGSQKTWSKYHDPKLFWPQQWLPLEPEICAARVLSFGYNAHFRTSGSKNISNIADFAKDLLFGMLFGKDTNTKDLEVGKVPIIFIVHSMGGLVVKKAYLLGQNDENYHDIVKSISAIMFLATPHRGTNLAGLLNRILYASFQSPKNFIIDLNKSSSALEEINEQFRHIAPKLSIFSFYETLLTTVGPKKLLILEKDSSILGYPGEISKPLDADHHDICKYTSREDPNYISVRNALKSLVGRFRSTGVDVLDSHVATEIRRIEKLFACSQNPEDDFDFFRGRWMAGTCNWILSEPAFKLWLAASQKSRIIWLTAPPASGKSILCTYIINQLQELGYDCQYYFFRFGDKRKCSLNTLLRSIGLQIAKHAPIFRRQLAQLSREGNKLEKLDARIIWQRIFIHVLSKVALSKPLYWVIDGLDESESPKVLPDLLQTLSKFVTPIHVIITSRMTEALSLAFDRLSVSGIVDRIQKDGREHATSDICMYVEQELKYMRGADELKREIAKRIVDGAEGNFLWVYLVLEEILSCHTETAIQQVLEEIPAGMSALYQRMELAIAGNPRDLNVAKTLLQWTICAHRSLTLRELSQALVLDFPRFLDLKRTIQDVCGQFIVVDSKSQVMMVHQTARDYLTKTRGLCFSIDLKVSHKELFTKTLSVLLHPLLRSKLEHDCDVLQDTEPFLLYSAVSWTYHLQQSSIASEDMLDLLLKFFKGHSVLRWIHLLSLMGRLEALVKSASVLSSFVNLNRKLNFEKNPLLHRLQDLEILDLWTTDLIKVTGKFGMHLVQNPTIIYQTIPPFCPQDSIIHRQFNQKSSVFSISGISNTTWNDCLARVMLQKGTKAWKITCTDNHFAVSTSVGVILLWNSLNFEEASKLSHAEHITAIRFNSSYDKLVSYGLKTTKIWAVPSGQHLISVPNPLHRKALAIAFTENDTKIVAASDDKIVRYFYIDHAKEGWQSLDSSLLQETSQIEGAIDPSPRCMAFNMDATQIAIASKSYPLSVWTVNEPRLVGRCKRLGEHRQDSTHPPATWSTVERVTWNPLTNHLLGLFKDGCIFKWNPIGDHYQEARTTADEIEIGPDGKLFITSDSSGTIKIWNFAYFSTIYKLVSENLVIGLAFSPDRKRFYDLRGSSINVWEPNCLIRLSETEETHSETTSEDQTSASTSQASEAWVLPVDPICAFAATLNGSLYCTGNEDGVVYLFDKWAGKLLEIVKFSSFLAVDHLVWGEDKKHIAAADLGGNIAVVHLIYPPSKIEAANLDVQYLLKVKINKDFGGIWQILLNQDSTRLLVVCQSCSQIWVIETGATDVHGTLEKEERRKWLNHPLQKIFFLGIGSQDLKVFRWDDLTEVACLQLPTDALDNIDRLGFAINRVDDLSRKGLLLEARNRLRSDFIISKVLFSEDVRHMLLQVCGVASQRRNISKTLIFEISPKLSHSNSSFASLDYLGIPTKLLKTIEIPLRILSGGKLVFLDNDMWICTLKLDSVNEMTATKRHYFIPRDWTSTEQLEQCSLLDDGTFLYPKDGEVAVIESNLVTTDW